MEIRQTPNPEVTGVISTGMPAWMIPPTIVPRADILDTGDQIVYLVDLAGVDPDKLVLEVSPTEVAINGPLSENFPRGTILHAERPRGAYTHLLSLPPQADPERVSVDLANGVLIIRFQKKEQPGA